MDGTCLPLVAGESSLAPRPAEHRPVIGSIHQVLNVTVPVGPCRPLSLWRAQLSGSEIHHGAARPPLLASGAQGVGAGAELQEEGGAGGSPAPVFLSQPVTVTRPQPLGKWVSLSGEVAPRETGGSDKQEREDRALWPLSDERPPGTLLRSLLDALQRPGRSPSFLFQPQRFGRETRGSWGGEGRLSQRGWDSMASQFWSMAVPQRFGKKKK
ncbi:pro-FMRFamide-related neuropeptide FF [Mauremys reevesii]|uniref:pro-FMRFamide-related neuropeptide FF n=1 Tax=Mauremys reevesii TaxID=260615 RepID=UPI00193FDCC1|nr:pro-FMRFamide-related neuropeptide FF [Mauremys reevesii]